MAAYPAPVPFTDRPASPSGGADAAGPKP